MSNKSLFCFHREFNIKLMKPYEYSPTEKFILWIIAVIGFFGLNLAFCYGLFFRQDLLLETLRNPISLVFVVEAFFVMGILAYYLSRWRLSRMHWGWFVALSLLGSMAFALPVVLLWPFKSSQN